MMQNTELPNVLLHPIPEVIIDRMKEEAARQFFLHSILPEDPAEWEKYRQELLRELGEAIRLKVDHDLPLETEITGRIERKGYYIEKLSFQSGRNRFVTGCLYVPEGEGPFPGVLALHGHRQDGHLNVKTQILGHILAQNGYVCFTPDSLGSGERAEVHGAFDHHTGHLGTLLNHLGETMTGIMLADNMRSVDLLLSLDIVDSEKIGVTGCSGGGNQTMYATAFDDRIKAGVSVCSAGTYRSYIMGENCICETIPNGINICEEAGLIACIAPRAYAMLNGLYDEYSTFVPSEMLDTYQSAVNIFKRLGTGENLQYRIFPTKHEYSPEAQKYMIEFFNQHLCGNPGKACRIPADIDYMTDEEAYVYPVGTRPDKVKGILGYCGTLTPHVQKYSSLLDAETRRACLEKCLNSSPVEISQHSADLAADGWQKVILMRSSGIPMPALLRPSRTGKWRIMAAPFGKKYLKGRSFFTESIRSQDGLLLIDQYGSGETGNDYNNPFCLDYHNFARSCFFLGKTMLGEWVRDYTAAAVWLKKQYGAAELTAYGLRDTAAAALLSGALYGEFDHLYLEEVPDSLNWHDTVPQMNVFTCAIYVTDILFYGDMKDFAKLLPEHCEVIRDKTLRMDGTIIP